MQNYYKDNECWIPTCIYDCRFCLESFTEGGLWQVSSDFTWSEWRNIELNMLSSESYVVTSYPPLSSKTFDIKLVDSSWTKPVITRTLRWNSPFFSKFSGTSCKKYPSTRGAYGIYKTGRWKQLHWLIEYVFTPYRQYFSHITAELRNSAYSYFMYD